MVYVYKGQQIEYLIDGTNCRIKDSFKVRSKSTMIAFINYLRQHDSFKVRSISSYLREWKSHNYLYEKNIEVERTKDTDLNVNEYWYRRLAYFFLHHLYKCEE